MMRCSLHHYRPVKGKKIQKLILSSQFCHRDWLTRSQARMSERLKATSQEIINSLKRKKNLANYAFL